MELAEKYKIIRSGGKLEPDDPLSEFLTKNGVSIPNKYLAPHFKKVVEKWETGTIEPIHRKSKVHKDKINVYHQQKEYAPENMVAEVLGLSITKFREILEGRGSTRFFAVDRIIQELGLTHLWYEDEHLALAYSLV